MGKTKVFLRDVACQKLLKSANVSRSYSKNNTGTVFLRHDVYNGRTHADATAENAWRRSVLVGDGIGSLLWVPVQRFAIGVNN